MFAELVEGGFPTLRKAPRPQPTAVASRMRPAMPVGRGGRNHKPPTIDRLPTSGHRTGDQLLIVPYNHIANDERLVYTVHPTSFSLEKLIVPYKRERHAYCFVQTNGSNGQHATYKDALHPHSIRYYTSQITDTKVGHKLSGCCTFISGLHGDTKE